MLGSVHTFYFTAALGGEKEQLLKVIDAPTSQMQKMRKMGFPKHMQKHFLCWRETVSCISGAWWGLAQTQVFGVRMRP